MHKPQVDLFGIRFDAVTRDYMVTRVDESIAHGTLLWLTFINVSILVQTLQEEKFRRLLETADYRLCDGMGLVHASRLLGRPLPEMVSGPYLLMRLLEHAADCGYRSYMLGSKPEIVERAALNAQQTYPKLILAGYRSGYFSDAEENDVVEQICRSKTQILFVGMGFPRERLFIARWRKNLNIPIIMDVGGAFTVVAGIHRLAPRWMSIMGIEWLYRMAQEPERLWKRYLVTNTRFAWLLLREAFRHLNQ